MSLERVVANLAQKVERRFYGKYRGFVVNNADPQRLGRLKLRVPSVLGADVVTGWAMPCVPYGGAAGQGWLFIPEKGAGVWVEFEEGDLEFPIWVGTFWSKPGGTSELPRPNGADGAEEGDAQNPPTRKIIKTMKGHTIQLEDKDGEELVMILDGASKHRVVMDTKGLTITDGVNKHTVVLSGDGISITDGKNSGNKITMASSGVTVQTSGTQVALSTTGVNVGGSGATEPFVLGTQFVNAVNSFLIMLSTHTHVGNLGAPTSPPVAPMTLQVPLSTKHKLDG